LSRRKRRTLLKLSWIVLGAVLLGLAWWVQQPIPTTIFWWELPVANPFAFLSFPLFLCGAGSVVYGLLAKKR